MGQRPIRMFHNFLEYFGNLLIKGGNVPVCCLGSTVRLTTLE